MRHAQAPVTAAAYCLALCLSLLILPFLAAASNPQEKTGEGAPDTSRVKEQHRFILEKYGYLEKKEKGGETVTPPRVEPEEEVPPPQQTSKTTSILIIFGVLVALVIIFFLAFRRMPVFMPQAPVQVSPAAAGPVVGGIPDLPPGDFQAALALAKEGKYGIAVLILHRRSVELLCEGRIIPPGGHFTNNDIRRLLHGHASNLGEHFSRLAAAAERVAFAHLEPTREGFGQMKVIYQQSFLPLDPGGNNKGRAA